MTLNIFNLITLSALFALSNTAFAFDISEREASTLVQNKYKAQKLLKVKSISNHGVKAFKVKILLNSGRLKTVYVNKKNGQISERQP